MIRWQPPEVETRRTLSLVSETRCGAACYGWRNYGDLMRLANIAFGCSGFDRSYERKDTHSAAASRGRPAEGRTAPSRTVEVASSDVFYSNGLHDVA
jgi:hypothetical protein